MLKIISYQQVATNKLYTKLEEMMTHYLKHKMLKEVSYGCETWSRRLRAEHRLRVFENRLLRNVV